MTPEEFVSDWQTTSLKERQSYQIHFNNLCDLVGYEKPSASGHDKQGNQFVFEQYGLGGFADVWLQGHFAIEYKAPQKFRQHKDLSEAYAQLLRYREQVFNPPLLVVTDIDTWEIHTNFVGVEHKTYKFTNAEIATEPRVMRWLTALFKSPGQLHPDRNTEAVTLDAALGFQLMVDNMRQWEAEPERIAKFLTKLVFCLFADGIGLLPSPPNSPRGVFSEIVHLFRTQPDRFAHYTEQLFQAMNDGGDVLAATIPYFNGSLFADVVVEKLQLEALEKLRSAADKNWASIEPAVFGTLFERVLDKTKRTQLGAHYTSRADILLITEPVLMQPLRKEWESLRLSAAAMRTRLEAARTLRDIDDIENVLRGIRQKMLTRLRTITVLDPACGSGNFLYVALQSLMDLEKAVINDPVFKGLTPIELPAVHPRQMYGIEKDTIAHALAGIAIWIGYIQWRANNGYGHMFDTPILKNIGENIVCKDAIIDLETKTEPDWPAVDVIVGNPPFLGGSKLRGELGDAYYKALTKLYKGRVEGGADLVTYWFERARAQIEAGKAKRAGLLATNSIRGGANREVLKRIKQTGDIFLAHADRAWFLEGAAVRVSIVGFDNGSEKERQFFGRDTTTPRMIETITPDLTTDVDITNAKSLPENASLAFRGNQKGGAFDISTQTAMEMLKAVNTAGKPNSDVIKKCFNGSDIVGVIRDNCYLIDFGISMPLEEARGYELPIAYIETHVKPERDSNNRRAYRERWWIHNETRPSMRKALAPLKRYIVTPHVSKHRVMVWLDRSILPDHQLIAIARDDDYFFGVLHSKLHEVWSLRMGTWLGVGNDPRYTPTTTFETFPFPYIPGKEPLKAPCYKAIAEAAKQLHTQRDQWLKHGIGKAKDRTLTNLYNALNAWRGKESMKTVAAAGDFAIRLDVLHQTLDKAVCAAYGWDASILADEEAILSKLLALNLERAASSASAPSSESSPL